MRRVLFCLKKGEARLSREARVSREEFLGLALRTFFSEEINFSREENLFVSARVFSLTWPRATSPYHPSKSVGPPAG